MSNRFWDDWMRRPEQRRDRACIRPEVSRTSISPEGKKGVSGYVYALNDSYFLLYLFVEVNFMMVI